ncbi:MAG: hypothetical protein AB1656_16870 [Candidatus Omnitrophota bacterium]
MNTKRKTILILVLLLLVVVIVLFITDNNKPITDQNDPNRIESEDNIHHYEYTQQNDNNAGYKLDLDFILSILTEVKRYLIANHNIRVTTDEIRNYLRKEIGPTITPKFLDETQKFGIAMIAASENVLHGTMTAKQAAEHFLSEYGSIDSYIEILATQSTQERIDEMIRMFPDDKEAMIEKSLKGHRVILEERKLADIVLSDELKPDRNAQWSTDLNKWVFNYSKEHLIKQYPELKNCDFQIVFPPMPLPPESMESRPGTGVPPGPRINNSTNSILRPMER